MENGFGIALPDALSDPRAMKLDDAMAVYRALAEQPTYYPTLERTHPKSYRVTMSFGHVEPEGVSELRRIVERAVPDARISLYADSRELDRHERTDDNASAGVVGVISIR